MIYNFCQNCGSEKIRKSTKPYNIRCVSCEHIFWPQSAIAVGAFIIVKKQLLLVKRTQEPYKGDWVIPSGFVEYAEDPATAIKREMQEELNIKIHDPRLFHVQMSTEKNMKSILGIYYYIKNYSGTIQPSSEVGDPTFFDLAKLPIMGFTANNSAYQVLLSKQIHEK